jgi:hypothetical protein
LVFLEYELVVSFALALVGIERLLPFDNA